MHNRLSGRRQRRRLAWTGAAIVLAGAVVLAWNFPARWALPWIAPSLHGVQLHQVHGSLWHGRAGRVVLPDGSELGRASWQVSRRVVYAAVPIQLHLDGPRLTFSASMRMLPHGRSRWEHVNLRADLAAWPDGWWLGPGQPVGEWRMTAEHALLQSGWPLQLELHARWHDAALRTSRGIVPLGELEWFASASNGVIDVRLHDVDDGPLQVAGQLLLSPLGWRLGAQLRARRADPVLQGWLATLGTADAAGVVRVQRHGGAVLLSPGAPAAAASAAHAGTSHLHP